MHDNNDNNINVLASKLRRNILHAINDRLIWSLKTSNVDDVEEVRLCIIIYF